MLYTAGALCSIFPLHLRCCLVSTEHLMVKAVIFQKPCDVGLPTEENFAIIDVPAPSEDELAEGDILVKLSVISVDPYMRNRMRSSKGKSYIGGFELGKPLSGFVAGSVIASKNPDWIAGDLIGFMGAYITVQKLPASHLKQPFTIKLTGHVDPARIGLAIGALGMPGATAYYGFNYIATSTRLDSPPPTFPTDKPKVLFVNAARGAVGSLVLQIAVRAGVKVIACAGGAAKTQWCLDHGASAAIDYRGKSTEELRAEILAAGVAIRGVDEETAGVEGVIDYVFENVGGIQTTAYFPLLRVHAKIAVCGAISGYNEEASERLKTAPPFDLWTIISKQVAVEGFLVFDFMANPQRRQEWLESTAALIKAGELEASETVVKGIDRFAEAFATLMSGGNDGKLVIDVSE